MNHDPGFHLSCDQYLSKGWGPPQLLLDTIDTATLRGLRDRALLGVMVYSFARVPAVVGMDDLSWLRRQREVWGVETAPTEWSKHPDVGKSAARKAVDNRAKRCLDELEQGSDQGLARSYFRVNPDVGTAG